MTRHRVTPVEMQAAALDAARTSLEAADVRVVDVVSSPSEAVMVHALVDARPITYELRVVSYCTRQRAEELIDHYRPAANGTPLVVADKITADARRALTDAGWSWLDRRGRLYLRGPGIRVDVDVPRTTQTTSATDTGPPIVGRGGVNVAYWLCAHPALSLSPTRNAAGLGLAPSTISTAVRRLQAAGLVRDDGTGLFPELFWELVEAWPTDRVWLSEAPQAAAHRPADPLATTWRRTGTAAAAAYGAPIVTSERGVVELYIPGPVEISIALRRYGATRDGTGAATITVAPATAVVTAPDDGTPVIDGWPAAPALAVALDLAQDRARGREMLADWRTDDAVWL